MRTCRAKSTARIGVVAVTAFLLASMTSVPAQAFNQVVIDQMQHFFECKTLLLTDPVAHAATCLPNRVARPGGSIESLHRFSIVENHVCKSS